MSNQREPMRGAEPAESGDSIEVFCIHSYAGEAGPPCGWRGCWEEVTRKFGQVVARCPRCGRSTVMAIPRPKQP